MLETSKYEGNDLTSLCHDSANHGMILCSECCFDTCCQNRGMVCKIASWFGQHRCL